MASATLQKIFNLQTGEFIRSSSGFFCRMPGGAIAFIPSVFRLPWQAKSARIVDSHDIARLLRAETMELATGLAFLFAGIHYFFSDILTFYMELLSLPLAIVAHVITTVTAIVVILALNNASVSIVRISMTKGLPKAPGSFTADALHRWSGKQRVWLLSFLNGERAANLNKMAVVLYLLMFLCSGPLLTIVLALLVTSGKAHTLNGSIGIMLALYIIISIWALIESTTVLFKRMQAGRRRREAKEAFVQAP